MDIQEIIVIAVFVITLIFILFKIKRRFTDRTQCDCSECGVRDCNLRD
jgi:hypothetical protein